MKPKDLFGVVIRAFGLFLIWHGFDQFAYYYNVTHGYSRLGTTTPDSLLTHMALDLILGACFLVGAPLILAVTYPTKRDAINETPRDEQGANGS